MAEISLCMIVRNEESVIDRCLSGIKDIADEIIIADTGSEDETKKIAAKYTDKIYDFKWIDDFSAARNFSFSKAEKDYIMWLDADDVIDDANKQKLLELKEKLGSGLSADMIMMKYHTAFDENGAPTFSYFRERIVRRVMNYKWVGAVHEVIVPRGNVVYSDIAVMHKKLRTADPDRNIRIFEKLEKSGASLDASQLLAMIGMPEEIQEQVTPDMSVRTIQKLRRGEPEKPPVDAPRVSVTAVKETEHPLLSDAGTAKTVAAAPKAGAPSSTEKPVLHAPAAGDKPQAAVKQTEQGNASVSRKLPDTPTVNPVKPLGQAGKTEASPTGNAVDLVEIDSYSDFKSMADELDLIMKQAFSADSPVRVKIVCVQG